MEGDAFRIIDEVLSSGMMKPLMHSRPELNPGSRADRPTAPTELEEIILWDLRKRRRGSKGYADI